MMGHFVEKLRRDRWLYPLAVLGLVVVASLAALGYWYIVIPTRFVVAVAPPDGSEAKLVASLAQVLQEQRKDVRLVVQPYDTVRLSAQALQDQRADFAVVRPDVLLPGNGLTVAILREEALIALALGGLQAEDFGDLVKKRLGVVVRHEADRAAVDALLAHYELGPQDIMVVSLEPDQVEAAVKDKRIDALAFVAAPTSDVARQLVRAASRAAGGKISVVPVAESEAFALKNPAVTEADIPPGALRGRPSIPKEEVKTIAVSYRLMARAGLDRGPVSKLTEYLFQTRSRIAQITPAVNLLKAPETEGATTSALPVHAGAIDYFNREQLTFMDRYGDWLWLALFAGGGVSSGFAWVAQLFARRRRELVDEILDRLVEILREARSTDSVTELEALTREIDGLVATSLKYARRRTTTTRVMSALMLAIDSARTAVDDRRRELCAVPTAQPGPQRPGTGVVQPGRGPE